MMEMFNDNPENLEFDWFPELSDNPEEIDFDNLVDFENEIAKTNNVEKTENNESMKFFAENRDLCEDPDEASFKIFTEVSKSLTGYELNAKSDFLFDYIEELNKNCTVLQSDLVEKNFSENALKIQMCIDEGGCVVGIVDGSQLDALYQQDNTRISGLRTILISDINEDSVIAYDLTVSPNKSLSIPVDEFSKMEGIILEVYK